MPFAHNTIQVSARAKLCAGVILIVTMVLLPHPTVVVYALGLVVLMLVAPLLGARLSEVIKGSLIVLLFAGVLALLAPLSYAPHLTMTGVKTAYATAWPLTVSIAYKAFFSALVVTTINHSSSPAHIIEALGQLHLPRIFLLLVGFIYRFSDLFRVQLHSMQQALDSRAPTLSRWGRVRLYGRLGGNLFVRAYERGEHVHAAMISRGYSGTLPEGAPVNWSTSDTACVVGAVILAALFVVYTIGL